MRAHSTPGQPRDTWDSGFTLIEVLVALFLVGVLGSIIATITIQATRSTHDVATRAEVQSQLLNAQMRVNQHVSHSDDFTVTTPTELVLSSTDTETAVCTLTRYQVTPDNALAVSRADCAPTPVWEPERAVVIDLDVAVPPFTYYDSNGNPVSPADPALVHRVKVHLTVGAQTLTSSATQREADDIQLIN